MQDFTLVLDIALIMLLAGAIAAAVVVARRIARLQSERDSLAEIVKEFAASTDVASARLADLRSLAEDAERRLVAPLSEAQNLAQDLEFLVERAEKAADSLSTKITATRPRAPAPAAPEDEFSMTASEAAKAAEELGARLARLQ